MTLAPCDPVHLYAELDNSAYNSPVIRLLDTTSTLYSELLEQLQRAQAAGLARTLQGGSLVTKSIHGRRYWYLQRTIGAANVQKYLGPDSPELAKTIADLQTDRTEQLDESHARAHLSAMLVAGGAFAPPSSIRTILGALADAGFFRLGAVLVGTQAFATYGNLLGFRLQSAALATQDIDIARGAGIDLALIDKPSANVEQALAETGMPFLPVPGLDRREPTTSFKVRGRELRVDFLTPARRGRPASAVALPGFGVAAQPLPFLDYLIEDPIWAAVVGGRGVLVRVPTPARFALHKLWTSKQRPASQHNRVRKDRQQAAELIEILSSERPEDLDRAWDALTLRPARAREISKILDEMDPPWQPPERR